MTVTILVATREGTVLGTDSTTTLTVRQRGTDKIVQLFNSAQKLFEIGPIVRQFVAGETFAGAVAVYGDGTFGPLSWRGFVSEFYCRRVRPAHGSLDVPRELLDFAQTKWAELRQTGEVTAGRSRMPACWWRRPARAATSCRAAASASGPPPSNRPRWARFSSAAT
jgi:hypothetical protein